MSSSCYSSSSSRRRCPRGEIRFFRVSKIRAGRLTLDGSGRRRESNYRRDHADQKLETSLSASCRAFPRERCPRKRLSEDPLRLVEKLLPSYVNDGRLKFCWRRWRKERTEIQGWEKREKKVRSYDLAVRLFKIPWQFLFSRFVRSPPPPPGTSRFREQKHLCLMTR